MSLVEEAKNNLMAYRRQSEELKQTRNCLVCGKTIVGDGQFCSFCGSRIDSNTILHSANAAPELICGRCGAVLDKDAKFCEKCRLPVEKTLEEAAEQVVDSSVVAGSAITFEQERFECPVCGEEVEEGATFCGNCGNRI